MKRIIYVFLITFSASCTFFAQEEWEQLLPQYDYIPYYPTITVIKVDKINNIWFGTSGYDNENGKTGGLAEYDGKVWKQYTKSNSLLPDNYITSIEFDLNNNTWIGMKDSGLAVIKDDKINLIREPFQFIEKGQVKNILADKKGNIWVLFISVRYPGRIYKPCALMKYDGMNWINFNLDSLDNSSWGIRTIKLDNDDNLYGGSYNKILKYDGSSWTQINLPVEKLVSCLSFDHENALWVGMNGYSLSEKVFIYNNGSWKSTSEEYNLYEPSEIVFDKNGNAWVASGSGLAKYDDNKWQYFTRKNSAVLCDGVSSLAFDSSGVLWCGTTFGACTLNGENWKYYYSSGGLPYEHVNKVLIDDNNNKWIATEDFGLAKYNGESWKVFDKSNSGIPFNDVNDIAIDTEKKIWAATGDGLGVFDGLSWTVYNQSTTGLPINNISNIKIDNKNRVWLISSNALFVFDGTAWKVFNSTNSDLPESFIGRLGIDNNNKIWVGTNDGFFIYDGDSWEYYTINNSLLPDNRVQCFAFDELGNSWIGTANGVVRINNDIWEIYNPNNTEMVGYDVDDIVIDSENNVWVGFYWDQGISKYDGKNWKNYNHIFDPALGGIDALSIDIDIYGNLWIGTLWYGLLVFNEKEIVSVNSKNKFFSETQKLEISAYPNPFNPTTTIRYTIPALTPSLSPRERVFAGQVRVTLVVYDVLGRAVATLMNEEKLPGKYEVKFDASKLSSGVYIYKITANDFIQSKKMLLMK